MTTSTPGHGQRPTKPPSPKDVARTNLHTVFGVLAGMVSFCYSLAFPMAGDSCPQNCRNPDVWIGLAYVVTWGGIATAALLTVRGSASSRRRGEETWIWPALSTALIVVTLVAGVFLADHTMINH